MKSNLFRALLLASIVAVPAMAAIPPSVTVRIGGAEELDLYHFLVREGDAISISATASAGDSIWVIAAPIQSTGEVDYSMGVVLIFDRKAVTGTVAADFLVPKELEVRSFAICAVARSAAGGIEQSTDTRVDVLHEEKVGSEK